MECSNTTPLLAWLIESKETSYDWQGRNVTRYAEADFNAKLNRYRLVFRPQAERSVIENFIASIQGVLRLALLERPGALLGIEISVDAPLSANCMAQVLGLKDIDFFLMPDSIPQLNQPGLLVMDMDSTAIEIECIDELAAMAGVGEAVAEVTELAMQGELDFEQSLRQRVAKLKGADAGIIEALCAKLPFSVGLRETVQLLQQYQWRLVVASGGFTPFVNYLKQSLSLDAAFANELVIADGCLMGEVTGDVVDAQYKADVVNRCAAEWNIGQGQRVAIGDGANDIPMVEAADYGIAYHAKPKLEAAADVSIAQLDLHALPFLLQMK